MTADPLWIATDTYLESVHGTADPVLDAALADSATAGLPAIAVSPLHGRLLQLLAESIGARRILEIGTLGGYSTICLARALPADGTLISLEREPKHAEVARANIARAGFADRVTVRVGTALESLAALEREGVERFDLVFVDADKPNIPAYVTHALALTHPGSLIVVDNVVRGGAVADAASTDEAVRGVQRFHAMLADLTTVRATSIQTVGMKGYDGFTLMRVEGEGREARERRNVATALRFVRAVEAGDSALVFDLYHPDVEQIEFPNSIAPKGATRDLAALQEAGERGKKVLQKQRYELRAAHAAGDVVTLESLWIGTLAIPLGSIPAGGEMRAHFAQIFEFEDGRIRRQRNYDCFEPF